jgi:hypothetical protein
MPNTTLTCQWHRHKGVSPWNAATSFPSAGTIRAAKRWRPARCWPLPIWPHPSWRPACPSWSDSPGSDPARREGRSCFASAGRTEKEVAGNTKCPQGLSARFGRTYRPVESCWFFLTGAAYDSYRTNRTFCVSSPTCIRPSLNGAVVHHLTWRTCAKKRSGDAHPASGLIAVLPSYPRPGPRRARGPAGTDAYADPARVSSRRSPVRSASAAASANFAAAWAASADPLAARPMTKPQTRSRCFRGSRR